MPFSEYVLFCISLVGGVAGSSQGADLTKQAVMLLLPFVLGFSTSLVIMLLNQFIEGVQAFFGKRTINVNTASPLNQTLPLVSGARAAPSTGGTPPPP